MSVLIVYISCTPEEAQLKKNFSDEIKNNFISRIGTIINRRYRRQKLKQSTQTPHWQRKTQKKELCENMYLYDFKGLKKYIKTIQNWEIFKNMPSFSLAKWAHIVCFNLTSWTIQLLKSSYKWIVRTQINLITEQNLFLMSIFKQFYWVSLFKKLVVTNLPPVAVRFS